MSFSTLTSRSTGSFSQRAERAAEAVAAADAVFVGVGAGLSAAAGFAYDGTRFERVFGDFAARFGITDMYGGGFYPFPTPELHWGWWSRMAWCNRYACGVGEPYRRLVRMLEGREHFILTTNVDHQLQRAGADKGRLFYTQGDYGLWQCSAPCHRRTYDNRDAVMAMVEAQRGPDGGWARMDVPTGLVPRCPVCGEPMTQNLRADDRFVEGAGWHEAAGRYRDFSARHRTGRCVYLELGVGGNTPGIVKFPFWRRVAENPDALYVQVNRDDAAVPAAIADRSVLFPEDAGEVLETLSAALGV